jgi:hypothetical protein
LTIKVAKDVGILTPIPYYDTGLPLFGYMPILFAILGAAVDVVFNDPPLSMFILYALVDGLIFLVIYKHFMKAQPFHIKLLFCTFFVCNLMFANLFPLGQRRRQPLALLLGMFLFLNKNRILTFLLTFLSLLAQPFVGFLMVVTYLIHSTEKEFKSISELLKRKSDMIIAVFGACLLAIPFYQGLIIKFFDEPHYYSCNNFSTLISPDAFDHLLFYLFIAFLLYDNREKLGISEVFSTVLIFSIFITSNFLSLVGDFFPFFIFNLFLRIFSMTCPANLLVVGFFSLIVSISLKGFKIKQLPLFFILVITMLYLLSTVGYLIQPQSTIEYYHDSVSTLKDNGIYNIKTMIFDVYKHSDIFYLAPRSTFLRLHGYSILADENLHFVDETSLPPEMSKGGTNIVNLNLATSILYKNLSCSDLVEDLRDSGVDGIAYYMSPLKGLQEEEYLEALTTFNDTKFLGNCSLDVIYFDNNYSAMERTYVVYKIRDD